jgi:hypothetical protein
MQYAAAQFGASNRVVADDTGMGSYYVAIPKMTNGLLLGTADTTTHPAFIVNGVEKSEVLIGKYHAFVKNNRAYSLPGVSPTASITFDTAATYVRNKGNGHHIVTNAELAMLALWCKLNNTQPRGNSNYGASSDVPSEVGIPATKETTGALRTLSTKTGASFPAWYHNGDLSGIDGLCGNVWSWCSGLRLNNGEINIIANNDVALPTADFSVTSALWQAILEDGTLVSPGTDGTLKYNGTNPVSIVKTITSTTAQSSRAFGTIFAGSDITSLPQLVYALGIAPADATAENYKSDGFWHNLTTERIAFRGGYWYYGALSGAFALALNIARSFSTTNVGFRPAFVSLP